MHIEQPIVIKMSIFMSVDLNNSFKIMLINKALNHRDVPGFVTAYPLMDMKERIAYNTSGIIIL